VHNFCHYNWAVDCGKRQSDLTESRAGGTCAYDYGIFAYRRCYPSYAICAAGRETEAQCEVGLVYDERIHTCNYPDLQLELGCNPSDLLGGFVCPKLEELSELERRFHPFPR